MTQRQLIRRAKVLLDSASIRLHNTCPSAADRKLIELHNLLTDYIAGEAPGEPKEPGTDDNGWGCAYCNCANKPEAQRCENCGKKKKVGSPFCLH